MTDANRQIYNLAQDGYSAEEIAEALGYSAEAVAVVLCQMPRSVAVVAKDATERKAASAAELEDRFERLQELALSGLEQLIVNSESDKVKADLIKYTLDQRLGLKRPAKAGTTVNIVAIEERLLRAKNKYAQENGAVITVESVPVPQTVAA